MATSGFATIEKNRATAAKKRPGSKTSVRGGRKKNVFRKKNVLVLLMIENVGRVFSLLKPCVVHTNCFLVKLSTCNGAESYWHSVATVELIAETTSILSIEGSISVYGPQSFWG